MKNSVSGNIENFSMYYIDEYNGEKYGIEGPPQEFIDFCHSIQVGDVYTMRLYSAGSESDVFFTW